MASPEDPGHDSDPYAPTYGKEVTVEAYYEVDRVAGSKRLQAVCLLLANGERWIRSYRPVPEEYPLVDRRVIATGRPYWNSPLVQHVVGTHFHPTSIVLAPGETPAFVPPSGRLPPAPWARDAAWLFSLEGRWARIVGRLLAVETSVGGDDPYDVHGTLVLRDGTHVGAAFHETFAPRWRSLVGEEVTVVGRLEKADDGTIGMRGRIAICRGDDPTCGT